MGTTNNFNYVKSGKISPASGFPKSTLANSSEQEPNNLHSPINSAVFRKGVLTSTSATSRQKDQRDGSSTQHCTQNKEPQPRNEKFNSHPTARGIPGKVIPLGTQKFQNLKLNLKRANSLDWTSVVNTAESLRGCRKTHLLSLPVNIDNIGLRKEKKADEETMTNKHGRNGIRCKRHEEKEISGSALVEACQSNNERRVKDLVRKLCLMSSAEVAPLINFQDHTGRTALSYASAYGNVTIIEELSKIRRLDPNLADNELNTPLHFASQAGQAAAVDLMLVRFQGVIHLNPKNITGLTPLHKAALQGRSRVAKSLIVAGASPAVRDYSRNMSAIDWARLTGRHICCEVIMRAARDKHCSSVSHSPASSINSQNHRAFPTSQSAMELKRINSDDSPYYHLQNTRNAISGANWLKNKLCKAFGSSNGYGASSSGNSTRPDYGLVSNLSGPTICAGSLILPSIKPIIDKQRPLKAQKLRIPTFQITPDKN